MTPFFKEILRRRTGLSASKAYNRWAPGYAPHPHNPFMELEEKAVLRLLPEVSGRAALDLACGSGRYLKLLRERGASPIVGVDLSLPMLEFARAFSGNLIRADLLSLPFLRCRFHLVICALALGHVRNLAGALKEVARILIPGGIVVFSDLHPLGSWLGWRRTFRDPDGREYSVRHHTHYFSDHQAACKSAGLKVEDICEPRIGFESKWKGYPALLVIRAARID